MTRAQRAAAGAMLGVLLATQAAPSPFLEKIPFDALDGWPSADHGVALDTFRNTCADLDPDVWGSVCAYATTDPPPRAFFELFFQPVRVGGPGQALYTGYYEPEYRAAREREEPYEYPVHTTPEELERGEAWLTRAEIAESEELDDYVVAWLRDPVDQYFLQMQGSGRLRLEDGEVLRLGYDARNGHPFRPVPAEIVRRGIYERHEVSEAVIRNWVRRNPDKGKEILLDDPSYIFFRVLEDEPSENGPRGALNRSLTADYSLAVDPGFVPLGAPVWVATEGPAPLRRLMIAQDTGGAIKGPGRGDVFFGTGAEAGMRASRMSDRGDMVMLLPIDRAHVMLDGG